VIQLSSGRSHSLFLKSDTTVYSCGRGIGGQLGLNDSNNRLIPTIISNFSNIKNISAGNSHSLFVTSDGYVYSCGSGSTGRLGLNSTTNQLIPTLISTISNIQAISAGDLHSLFLKSDGNVYSCGNGGGGRLGLGNNTSNNLIPMLISTISNVSKISAGYDYSIFIKSDGYVYACGYNSKYQLALPSSLSYLIPTLINSFTAITDVTTSLDTSTSTIFYTPALDINTNIINYRYNINHSNISNGFYSSSTSTLSPVKNITIFKNNSNIAFQINKQNVFQTTWNLDNNWRHIIWNMTNSTSTHGFIRIDNGIKYYFDEVPILSTQYNNYLGNTSNVGKLFVNDFQIITSPITSSIEDSLYINQLSYAKLAEEDLIINTSNILLNSITATSNILVHTLTLTSNTLANSLINTSNTISSRVTTLDTRVTSLDTNISNYLNATSNTLTNSLLNISNILSNSITNLSADQIADGTTKRFIISNTYNNDLIVKGKLTASNLDIIGQTTTINTSTYQTENL
jgi:ribosomal protein L27